MRVSKPAFLSLGSNDILDVRLRFVLSTANLFVSSLYRTETYGSESTIAV